MINYDSLQDYFDEVDRELNTPDFDDKFFPTLTGDFFPYTDEREEYWTGYFTTRPFDKLAGRELEHFIRY